MLIAMLQCYTQVEKKEMKAEEEKRSEVSEEGHAKQSGAVYFAHTPKSTTKHS